MTVFRLPLVAGALCLGATASLAGPLDDAHVGGVGFSGPTTGDVTAVYWNPASLGLLQGNQLVLSGALESTSVTVERRSIDPATGQVGGGRSFAPASGGGVAHPMAWPPGPGGFVGLGAGIGQSFAIALAAYSPYAQKLSFDAGVDGQQPLRYHLVSVRSRHLALVPALAIHASESLQFGVAPGLLFSSGRLVFDHDSAMEDPALDCAGAPCGAENPAAAARYDLASRGTQMPTYFVSGGVHYRRGRLDLGLAYTSAPLGSDGEVRLSVEQSQISLPARLGGTAELCPPGSSQSCLTGQMGFHLPGFLTLGATWHATPRLAVTGIVRWLRYGSHDRVRIRLLGPAAPDWLGTEVPDTMVLYRGFQDTWDLRSRLAYAVGTSVRLAGTLRAETSAVPAAHLNAAAPDGFKLEPALAVELSLWGWLRLQAGYALLWMLPVAGGGSAFDPGAAASCARAAGDLANPACQQRMAGTARPSAAGDYKMLRHTLAAQTRVSF